MKPMARHLMNRFYRTILAIVCAGPLAGCPGTITGIVRDARTEDPISGARVVIERQADETTGDDGEFMLTVDPGEYSVEVSAPGYEPRTLPGIIVRSDPPVDLGEIPLAPDILDPGPLIRIINASTVTLADVAVLGDTDEVFMETVAPNTVESGSPVTLTRAGSEMFFAAQLDDGVSGEPLGWSGIAAPEMWFLIEPDDSNPDTLDVRQLSPMDAKLELDAVPGLLVRP